MSLSQWYHYLNYEIADKRANDWFLISSPVPVIIISLAYLYLVLKCGPKYMENRPAYSCSTFIKIYDIFQIIANSLIMYLLYDNGWFRDYGFRILPLDFSVTPQNMQFGKISWWLLWLKLIDYIETCLFVLRKKNRQVSALHVYHHISTVYLIWINTKYYGSGMGISAAVVNCPIHVIMYTYYLLSSMGPRMQKLLHPIKPIITIVQMVQFVFLIIYTLRSYYSGSLRENIGATILRDVSASKISSRPIMSLSQWYYYVNSEVADPKTNDWFLISSPIPGITISLAYLYFILKCGPKYMENRPAYSCSTFMKIYNIFQIIANATAVYLLYDNGWFRDYGLRCTKFDLSPTPQNIQFAKISWWLLWLKVIDYIETCLFVLRKKNRQISFLHVYHHISTVFIAWVNVKYYGSGMALIVPVINSSIHVIMYTYYLLSSMGPKMQKLLHPIKHIITTMQMVQFVFLIIHSLRAYFPGCPGTEVGAGLLLVDLIINFILFYNFYQRNYMEKMKQK